MSLLAPLRRPNVRITILAVVIGVQVSNVMSSVLHAVAQAIQFAFYPARLPGIDLVRALKSSLFLVVTQTVLSALVAVGTIWLLARLLASNSDSAEWHLSFQTHHRLTSACSGLATLAADARR